MRHSSKRGAHCTLSVGLHLSTLPLPSPPRRDKEHPLYKEFGKLQYPILLQLQPLLKDLDQVRFLPWIESGSWCASETEGPPVGPEVFPMSLASHSPATTDQHQPPAAGVEEEEEVTGSIEMMVVSSSLLSCVAVCQVGALLAEMGRPCSALHRRENMVALRTNWLL